MPAIVYLNADLWLALADITQLELAILNLVVNARDAMPTGGVLRVRARNRHYPGSNGLRGDFVELSFADTGEGIPPEHIEGIFDPFFTTKAVGKGTGLGLSQVYGFVRQSGGDVRVVSALGQGTTITLLIPRALPAAITAEHVAESGTQFRGKGEYVLLVEDNDAVGEVIGQMLELIGLSIHRVSSARQALQLVRDGQPFDLVLSDIVMPGGMSGIDLARAVRDSRMDLPVVLITGYSQAIKDAVKLNVPILRKPFSIDELSVVVQKALAGRQKS